MKICGIGLNNFDESKKMLWCRSESPLFIAPEMIIKGYCDNFTVDVWSCGVILYAMICGYLPFDDDDDIFKKMVNNFLILNEKIIYIINKVKFKLSKFLFIFLCYFL